MHKSWWLFLFVMAMLSLHSVTLAQTEPLEVVASFSILADVVAQVAGEHATVTAVMPLGDVTEPGHKHLPIAWVSASGNFLPFCLTQSMTVV
jgi:ABC-type Zn uptake system ZnuABC Zn-binding protein ZnuA